MTEVHRQNETTKFYIGCDENEWIMVQIKSNEINGTFLHIMGSPTFDLEVKPLATNSLMLRLRDE